MKRHRKLRVLHSLAAPSLRNPYAAHMSDSAVDEVDTAFLSWGRALFGRYDVLHVHWPELLVRAPTRLKRTAKRIAALALLARLRVTRTPIVRTLHNVYPHEAGDPHERAWLARFDEATSWYIRLNPTTQAPTAKPIQTILHGHYRQEYAAAPRCERVPGRVLFAGIIRAYKGLGQLIAVFTADDDPRLSLRIVGSPAAGMRELVEDACARDKRISSRLEYVPEEQLVAEISSAELVVLPYHELHNSGMALAVLSCDRPVLLPRNAATEALRAEAGDDWVYLFDGELSTDALAGARNAAATLSPRSRPRLADRDAAIIGRRHYEAYRRAIAGGNAR